MANYNPSAPIVLGEEWVGIRDEEVSYAPGVSTNEVGHTFTLTQSRILADGRFYLADMPGGLDYGWHFMSVYPNGTEDQSGPIKRVVIPCNNGSVSGVSTSLTNATTFADAVFSPSDNKYANGWTGGTSTGGPTPSVWLAYFATNSFSQTLTGKRIVGVNLLYSLYTTAYLLPLEDRPYLRVGLGQGLSTSTAQIVYGVTDGDGDLGNLYHVQSGDVLAPPEPRRMSLGNFNPFWDSATTPGTNADTMPWTYEALRRMESGATNAFGVKVEGTTTGDTTAQSGIFYLALEVFYCEEQRLAVGGVSLGVSSLPDIKRNPFVITTNKITMRNPLTGALNPTLPAGEYLVTYSVGDFGYYNPTGFLTLNALREKESIPGIVGKEVSVPFPYDDAMVGAQFTSEEVMILPQLSLHTSGAPLTEVHVYGRQVQASVYGSVTATQEILDSAAGGAKSWPQVRFYARRFGDTTQPLLLDSPTIVGSSASLTPTEFDSLDEIVDGWREVTLRFNTAPTMGAGTTPQWRFSSSSETAGNQWQVLGMSAPALSGTLGSGFTGTVPSNQLLSVATYGASGSGSTVNLGWLSPMVSATTDDVTSDAMLLFSQDPPTPSGFSVTAGQQDLSTVDSECVNYTPGCLPNTLYFNQLNWAPVTGSYSYEIQRYDVVDGDFTTIMLASSAAVTGFSDYEARVGLPSVYRIRTVNLYDFAGLWSTQVTGTVPSPGVAGADTALMLFTTNARQDGSSNLAYSAAWESGRPSEDYAWPEAGTVVLQDMFDKDYPTAFRPLERGGERFARQILVNAAGIPPATLARGFENLRNMAWDTVPYICVRNEDGERWYATVVVPGGNVRRMVALGRLCMAAVQVVETSATPYAVDPS